MDVITDILVLIEFYIDGKMVFFYSSLMILIVAQFAYTLAFWYKFINSYNGDGGAVIGCCVLLPFAPILSFAFYFTENENKPLYKCIHGVFSSFNCKFDCCSSSNDDKQNDTKKDEKMQALKEWAEQKMMKHLGFIIEAMIEGKVYSFYNVDFIKIMII